jgi:hypothetical protein
MSLFTDASRVTAIGAFQSSRRDHAIGRCCPLADLADARGQW